MKIVINVLALYGAYKLYEEYATDMNKRKLVSWDRKAMSDKRRVIADKTKQLGNWVVAEKDRVRMEVYNADF